MAEGAGGGQPGSGTRSAKGAAAEGAPGASGDGSHWASWRCEAEDTDTPFWEIQFPSSSVGQKCICLLRLPHRTPGLGSFTAGSLSTGPGGRMARLQAGFSGPLSWLQKVSPPHVLT